MHDEMTTLTDYYNENCHQIKPETFPTYIEEIDQNGEVTKTY